MRRDEVLQYVKTFTEIRLDRKFDRTSRRIRHQPTHTGKLLDLLVRTTGAGIRHHIYIIVFVQTIKKRFGNLVIGIFPCLDHCVVTLFLCQKTAPEVFKYIFHCSLCLGQDRLLCFGHFHIRDGYGHRCPCRKFVTKGFDRIKRFRRLRRALIVNTFFKDLL